MTIDTIQCVSSLDITGVQQLHAQLLAALQGDQTLTLDLSQIERIDTAGLQLLLSLQRDAQARGLQVGWGQPSAAFLNTASLMGVRQYFAS